MSNFRYMLQYRKVVENDRPDALFRRPLDNSSEANYRLLSWEWQFLKPLKVHKFSIDSIKIEEGKEIFVNENLQILWNQAIRRDSSVKIVQTYHNKEKKWPTHLKIQKEGSDESKPLKTMVESCSFDQEARTLYYQWRIFVPNCQSLMTVLTQNTHDGYVSGRIIQVEVEY